MKFVCSIQQLEEIEKLPCEGIVFGCGYSSYCAHEFTRKEIHEGIARCRKSGKEAFLLINFIMHVGDEENVSSFLEEWKENDCHFIFQDLGIFHLLKKKGMLSRGIYYPLTMIANAMDMEEYVSRGVDAVGISSEIPLEDVRKCTEVSEDIFYLGFGYVPMYQTYRKLITLYGEEVKKEFPKDHLFLEEKTRNGERCPCIENKYGTVIFRNGVIHVLKELSSLNVKYLFLDSIFLTEDVFAKAVSIYHQVKNKEITLEQAEAEFESLHLPVNNTFMYQDSVYNPKEFE